MPRKRSQQPEPDIKSELLDLCNSTVITPPEELLRPFLVSLPMGDPPIAGTTIGDPPRIDPPTGAPPRGVTPLVKAPTGVLGTGNAPVADQRAGTPPIGGPAAGGWGVGAPPTGNPRMGDRAVGSEPRGGPAVGSNATTGISSGGVKSIGAAPVSDPDQLRALLGGMGIERRVKVIRAASVQDGHSQSEDALYWWLWRQGREVNGSQSRYLMAGYAQISAGFQMDRSNIQIILRALEAKKAIRVAATATVTKPTVYEIFSPKQILDRRREAGLLWITRKGGRGVQFVRQDGSPIGNSPVGRPPMGNIPVGDPPAGATPRVGKTPIEAMGKGPIQGVGETPTQLTNTEKYQASSSIQRIAGPKLDTAAAGVLWALCRSERPDITPEEFVRVFEIEWTRISRNKRVENPVGLLLSPDHGLQTNCTRLLEMVRSGVGQSREDQEILVSREELQATLDDPNAPEALKEHARRAISKL